jgi:hypothetical protein
MPLIKPEQEIELFDACSGLDYVTKKHKSPQQCE